MINKGITMIYKLMIKTQNKTGLKYLCITKRHDWENYAGSGTHWKNHLKKHGNDISTELLYETDDYQEFVIWCLFYSELFNVVLSEEFANQIPESGYDSTKDENDLGLCNFEIWWKYSSDEMKKIIYDKRAKTLRQNHWCNNINISGEIKQKISLKQIEYWDKFTLEERRAYTNHARELAHVFFENRESEKYLKYVESQSFNMKKYCSSIPFEVLSNRNRTHRLNISQEKKQLRKEKIQQIYKTGKHDLLYERYSSERIGIDNPNAKITVWYGVEYTKKDFKQFLKNNKMNESYAESILDNNNIKNCYRKFDLNSIKKYDIIICPYCNKQSSTTKKPSTFKRWHFENCKKRYVNEKIN